MKNIQHLYNAIVISALLACAGCDNQANFRTYTEEFSDPKANKFHASMNDDPHDFMKMMPQDDIHANLTLSHAMESDLNGGSPNISPIAWKTPQGWNEIKGSGLRLATLTPQDESDPSQITIITLAGIAGGLNGNVIRWMGQLNMNIPPEDQLNDFLANQKRIKTDAGLSAVIVDLTQIQSQRNSQEKSMIVSIIDDGDSKIFLKLTGTKESVSNNLAALHQLTQSVKPSK